MAKIVCAGKEIEVADGASIKEAGKELGVPFGCENGVCGTCQLEVVSGSENLLALNELEEDMGMDAQHRLCCQAKVKEGSVEVRF